jgi:hypothetical protein
VVLALSLIRVLLLKALPLAHYEVSSGGNCFLLSYELLLLHGLFTTETGSERCCTGAVDACGRYTARWQATWALQVANDAVEASRWVRGNLWADGR